MLTDLRPERSSTCLSDIRFDAWRAGELAADELVAAEAHVAGCQRCRERRRALDAAAEAFLERFPTLSRRAKASGEPATKVVRSAGFRPALAWAGAGLAVAAAALFLFVRTGSQVQDQGEEGTRIKGAERIGFFVRRGEQVFEGVDGQRVRPGDQLRFVASTLAPRHLAILSRDAAGVASVYYPTASTRSRALGAAQSGPLESAVELDGTLGREQLFGVFCDGPFELEPLRIGLERDAKLAAAAGCKIDRIELVKERAE